MILSGKETRIPKGLWTATSKPLVDLIAIKYLSTTSETKPFGFSRKAPCLTLDEMSDASYREPFEYLASGFDMYELIATVEKGSTFTLMVTVYPSLIRFCV